MRENVVENYLVKGVVELGGLCWKMQGTIGMPDRVVILPGGEITLVELKTKGGKLSAWQKKRHGQLRDRGVEVVVLWSKEDVDEFLSTRVMRSGGEKF